jgi:DNA invertase Pin-like site-specific DNA recombinase
MKGRTPAFAYLRVSGKGQVQGDGFDRQRDAVHRFAKLNSYEIIEEFRDEGVSGSRELASRPGLARLLDRIESNGVKTILVERADRLARDLMVNEVIVHQFTRLGARVMTSDGADLAADENEPTKTLIRQVLAAVSQFEKSVIVLKLRAARERVKRRSGRCEGRKPFGFYPGEAPILDRIQRLRRKQRLQPRMSFAAIARILNTDRVPSRTGRPWAPGSVHAIIRRLGNGPSI